MKISLGVVFLLCAYALLFPGLTQPILSVAGTVEKVKLVEVGKQLIQDSPNTPAMVTNLVNMVVDNLQVSGSIDAFAKTRSIIGTAEELYHNQHAFVAILIVVFSVLIPLVKALLLLGLLLPIATNIKSVLLSASDGLSKWSMADVFVIAIFIAYLASNGIRESDGLVNFDATLGNGFWFFLGYCLVSILGTQLLSAGMRHKISTAKRRPAPELEPSVEKSYQTSGPSR
ncbi:MAG: paraquat-inducible protein A [Granulosicoccus sp.]